MAATSKRVKALSFENLSHILWDEANELLSKDFAKEIDDILRLCTSPGWLHQWFFSSQYQPEHIEKAKSLMADDYLDVDFDLPEENAAIRYCLVKQKFVEAGENMSERFESLKTTLRTEIIKTLVLCQTHASVEWLHNAFTSLNNPFRSTHGGCSQEKREHAIREFKKGNVPILVSTMGMGVRGLNFKEVDCLIFWEMPESLDQYR